MGAESVSRNMSVVVKEAEQWMLVTDPRKNNDGLELAMCQAYIRGESDKNELLLTQRYFIVLASKISEIVAVQKTPLGTPKPEGGYYCTYIRLDSGERKVRLFHPIS